MSRTRLAGFTLIELMVVVVIISILASIAVPAYTSSIRKSRRTEAKTALTDAAAREERYFATQNIYSSDPNALAYGTGALPIAIGTYYAIASVAATGPTAPNGATLGSPGTFTVTIKPITGSPQAQDASCQAFLIDQTGKETSQDGSGNDTTSTCWP